MRNLKILLILILLISCKNSNSKLQNINDSFYCAEVDYHNSKTNTDRNYSLSVEVKNKSLVKIYFSNGGWLDDTHFTPPALSNGKLPSKMTEIDIMRL
jgi:hypothetical protein